MTTTNRAGSPAGTLQRALAADAQAFAGPITIWPDGSCQPNPGMGSYAWVAVHADGMETQGSGAIRDETTNSRAELTAAAEALEALSVPSVVTVRLDSEYVQLGMDRRLKGWIKAGWRTKGDKPVANIDLWQRLAAAAAPHKVEWRWVRGHSGDAMNTRVDELANKARLAVLW